MNEVRNFSRSINSLHSVCDTLGHHAGPTGEHPHLTHITVLLLNKLEEGWHVGSAEMVDGLQSSEHGSPAQTLEVVLADVEHRGPEVKLVEELGDENMHFKHIRNVFLLNVP